MILASIDLAPFIGALTAFLAALAGLIGVATRLICSRINTRAEDVKKHVTETARGHHTTKAKP